MINDKILEEWKLVTGQQARKRYRLLCLTLIILATFCSSNSFASVYPKVSYIKSAKLKNESFAHDIYDRMVQTMREAKSMIIEGTYSSKERGIVQHQGRFKLWMKKPYYSYLEVMESNGHTGVLIGDGQFFWIYWPDGRPRNDFDIMDPSKYESTRNNVYMKLNGWDLSHLAGLMGVGTVLQFSIFHGDDDNIGKKPDKMLCVGSKRVSGEECDSIEINRVSGQRNLFLSFSMRDHMPRKLKQVIHLSNGDVINDQKWVTVRLDDYIPDDKFIWKPPIGWSEYRWPTPQEVINLKPGMIAPDFKLSSLDGTKLKLSSFRGKVVWLFLWEAG